MRSCGWPTNGSWRRIRHANSERLSETTAHTLRALNYDFRYRAGSDKSADIFRQIDDKWLFTRNYFATIATEIGAVSVEIEPLWAGEDVFVMQTGTYLKLAPGSY